VESDGMFMNGRNVIDKNYSNEIKVFKRKASLMP
jgi:hypothetical protein